MALTRAQLLAGNQDQGIVLSGQVRAVTAGSGVTISPQGVLSINSSDPTFNGFIKTNSLSAYNSYVWPDDPGTNKQFLQTNGAGLLDWADPTGFSVVTVQPQPAPTDPDIGELWFDCTTGSLNVYQDCYGSADWFNVAQAGRPVDPDNVDAIPAFTSGTGTQADPYICAVTTVSSGSSVYIVNAVQVTGLAPNQYVPIVDLRAAINGGRFQFTNYYADASGVLDFEVVFIDLPSSPPTTTFTAEIKIGYGSAYLESSINIVDSLMVTGGTISGPIYDGQRLTYTPGIASGGVPPYNYSYQWYQDGVAISGATNTTFTLTSGQVGKVITAITTVVDDINEMESATSNTLGPILANPGALTITSAGAITPSTNVAVGDTLNYTQGSFSGGIPPVAEGWVWQRDGSTIAGTEDAFSYVTQAADSGASITVRYSVIDSATPTPTQLSQNTSAVIPTSPFPTPEWNPGPAGGLNTIPGLISGVYNGASPVQVTGCLEGSRNGGVSWATGSIPIVAGETLQVRWKDTAGCGLEATGTQLTGTVTDGAHTNSYSITIDRTPSGFGFAAGSTSAALSSLQTSGPASILGINTTAYATLGSLTAGATGLQGSLDNGGTWNSFPASGTGFPVTNGANLLVRYITGANTGATYSAVINIGDGDNVNFTASSPGFVVKNTSNPDFPNTVFTPAGAPNASPASVNFGASSLYGTATTDGSGWQDGSRNLIATGDLQFKVGAGSYGQSSTPVVNGNAVSLIWNPSAIASAANGATLSGNLETVPALYSNDYSIIVNRSSTFTLPTATNAAFNTPQTTNAFTPTGFNVPVTVSFANPTTSGALPMSAVSYSINGNTPVAVTLGTTSATLNPGESLQIYGTTGSASTTQYGVRVTIGASAAQEWLVTTVNTPPSIATPSISTPTANATGVGTPTGLTITTSGYSAQFGAGAQTGSELELYKNGAPITSTNTISGVAQNSASWAQVTTFSGYYSFAAGSGGTIFAVAESNLVAPLKSTDGGATWSAAVGGLAQGWQQIVGNGAGKLVAANNGGYSYSTNNGASWATSGGTAFSSTSNQVYAGVMVGDIALFAGGGNNPVLYRSTNGGASFALNQSLGGGDRYYGLAYDSSTGAFWAVATVSGTSNVYKSTDNGASWTTNFTPGGFNITGIATDNAGNMIFTRWSGSGNTTVYKSTNAGASWSSVSTVTGGVFNPYWSSALGVWIVVDSSGSAIQYSSDAVTWTASAIGGSFSPKSQTNSAVFATSTGEIVVGGSGPTYRNSLLTGSTTLSIAGADTDGFAVGDKIVSDPGAAASGTITGVTSSTVTVIPSSANWSNGQRIKINPSSYSAVSGSPFLKSSAPFNSFDIAKPPLEANTVYYTRVRYSTNSPSAITSDWSAWRKFTTGSLVNQGNITVLSTTGPANIRGRLNTTGSSYLTAAFTPTGGSSPGALISTNGGGTWSSVWSTYDNGGVTQMRTTGTGFVMTQGRELWFSSNGTTWNQVGPASNTKNFDVFAVRSDNPNEVLNCRGNATSTAIEAVYSTDGGQTWTVSSNTIPPSGLSFNPGLGQATYFTGAGLWLYPVNTKVASSSTLSGVWSVTGSNLFATAIVSIASSSTNALAITYTGSTQYTTNGTTWQAGPTLDAGASWYDLAFVGGAYFAVGQKPNGSGPVIVARISQDLSTVTYPTIPASITSIVGPGYGVTELPGGIGAVSVLASPSAFFTFS